MADIFGALGLPDTDYAFINTIGQSVVYDATLQVLGDHNADLAASEAVFVEGTTWDHRIKYKLPERGLPPAQGLADRGRGSPSPMAAGTSRFSLEEFGAGIGWDRTTAAYMTVGQYNLALEGVLRKDRNTRRVEVLKKMFSTTPRRSRRGVASLTVVPLANGDSAAYPPVIGWFAETTANNYLASGYAYTAISDTNDPIPTMVNPLEQYLGTPTGGSKIAIFFNNEETPYLQASRSSTPCPTGSSRTASTVPRAIRGCKSLICASIDKLPLGLPGRVLGETDRALIVEWRWIPAGYMFGVHLDAPQPLRSGSTRPRSPGYGLMLTSQSVDEPLRFSEWSCRFGFGVANRLNGVAMQLTTGSYTVPTIAGAITVAHASTRWPWPRASTLRRSRPPDNSRRNPSGPPSRISIKTMKTVESIEARLAHRKRAGDR